MSKLVIGNQKMYMNKEDVIAFRDMLKETDLTNKEVIVCPTYPFLEYYDGIVPVGAQNVSTNDNGAFTGEVSSHQLKSLNIPYYTSAFKSLLIALFCFFFFSIVLDIKENKAINTA